MLLLDADKACEISNLETDLQPYLLRKSVPLDKDKHLMDYTPDFDRAELRQIITVRDNLEQLLSVRDMDEAVTKLFIGSLHVYRLSWART